MAGAESNIGSVRKRRRNSLNPEGGRDNCVACLCAFITRVETGDPDITAKMIENEYGLTSARRQGSNPLVATVRSALSYIQKATGLPVPDSKGSTSEFSLARMSGHYAIFVEKTHVVWGRVWESGRHLVFDPQIARAFKSLEEYRGYIAKNQSSFYGRCPRFEIHYLGPVTQRSTIAE
jgi:hypothetical protein